MSVETWGYSFWVFPIPLFSVEWGYQRRNIDNPLISTEINYYVYCLLRVHAYDELKE